uniref:Protein of unassigned function n=1 Tax=Methylobacterium oryzae CBMB20 TaxID=693986 RepID=A0A088B2H6_9HYPH|nr:protein of unassigned function [Methylobacterium oryzae CBMB20]
MRKICTLCLLLAVISLASPQPGTKGSGLSTLPAPVLMADIGRWTNA